MTKPGTIGILVGVEVESGVASDGGHPFLTVRARAEDGSVLVGQLDVETARKMALDWLVSCEAAEMDAMVLAELVEGLGQPMELAARFVGALRARRLPG